MNEDNKQRCNQKKNFLGKWHICGVRHGATLRTWYCDKHKNKEVRK